MSATSLSPALVCDMSVVERIVVRRDVRISGGCESERRLVGANRTTDGYRNTRSVVSQGPRPDPVICLTQSERSAAHPDVLLGWD